jgi:hypothetical protein
MDAVQYVAKTPGQPLYLDPPYFEKGPGLYRVSMSRRQHLDLSMALNRHTRWVLSLDHPDDIVAMYLLHRVAEIHAGYSISKTRKTEHIYRSTHPLKPSLALSGLEATQGMEPSLKFLDRQVGGDFVKRVRKGLSKTLGPEWEANYRAARLAEKKSPKRPSRRI